MKNIKYVILDYNGTITDDVEIGWKSCNHLLKFYGKKEISLERFRETFVLPWMDFYIIHGVKRDDIHIPTHQREYQKMHTTLARQGLKTRPYLKETINYWKNKGIKIGLLTSRNKIDLENELTSLGLQNAFDAVICEEHINQDGIRAEKKTDIIIEKLGITDPSEVFCLGDMITDIRLAKQYKFVSGALSGGWHDEKRLRAEEPDHFFKSFIEVKKKFE